jgi:hypothetical protein
MSVSRSYLLILSDRDAIAWVLREQRMAFPATRRAELALTIDDRLLLYTTRGAWSNPTHSRGRVDHLAVRCRNASSSPTGMSRSCSPNAASRPTMSALTGACSDSRRCWQPSARAERSQF